MWTLIVSIVQLHQGLAELTTCHPPQEFTSYVFMDLLRLYRLALPMLLHISLNKTMCLVQ